MFSHTARGNIMAPSKTSTPSVVHKFMSGDHEAKGVHWLTSLQTKQRVDGVRKAAIGAKRHLK